MRTATLGSKSAIEPSLSSTSQTKVSPLAQNGAGKGDGEGSAKFFMTAPLTTVGDTAAGVQDPADHAGRGRLAAGPTHG